MLRDEFSRFDVNMAGIRGRGTGGYPRRDDHAHSMRSARMENVIGRGGEREEEEEA